MLRANARTRKPILLLLVFGVFLMIVGITALAQAVLVSTDYSYSMLKAVVGNDAATVRTFANANLLPSDLATTGIGTSRAALIASRMRAMVEPDGFVRFEVRLPSGEVVLSDVAGLDGSTAANSTAFATAAGGRATADLVPTSSSEAVGSALPMTSDTVLREYFPIKSGDQVQAVIGVWRDAGPILAALESVRRDVIVVTITAGVVAAIVLYLVFRAAQGRINRQTEQLVEATRRDPLTGTPNHGTLVTALAEAMEAARPKHEPIAVALLDIDNFRLLNDTHGHLAGDQAILTVAELLQAEFPGPGTTVGRYGPDEFLVVEPSVDVQTLERALERFRAALVGRALAFDGSEALPVTVSAGVCAFPDNGGSVTELLSIAAVTLQEARTSGGDAILIAGGSIDLPAETRTFDVFQGLILAIDGKDRYTKRHSEDVARYAVFLADRLTLDPDLIATIRVAGLLHDVGKIGIPDGILRKPARLTEAEYDIVKQHVALGDMIVRDLPNIELIRAGVRHHHERWDGQGYLDRLEGDQIPLIGRILAVGDAFSAMTTTRPYRKAHERGRGAPEARGRRRDPARGAPRRRVRRRDPDRGRPAAARHGDDAGAAVGAVHEGRLSDACRPRPGDERDGGPARSRPRRRSCSRWRLAGEVTAAQTWTVGADKATVPLGVASDGDADDHEHLGRRRRWGGDRLRHDRHPGDRPAQRHVSRHRGHGELREQRQVVARIGQRRQPERDQGDRRLERRSAPRRSRRRPTRPRGPRHGQDARGRELDR